MGTLETIPQPRINVKEESSPTRWEGLCEENPLLTSRIAIVDDIEINIKVARALLQAEGYENFFAITDAEQAISTISEVVPDLLLLDIMMPNVSGIEILQMLRKSDDFNRLPILVDTGSGHLMGLSNDNYPVEGPITAVADAFDNLSNRKTQIDLLSVDQCLELLEEKSGTQFDPAIIEAFLRRIDDVLLAKIEHGDE